MIRRSRAKRRLHGYIMVEAVMAIALLSVGTVAIQGALRQAILTRGQAKDYTHAKFLLEQLIADLELQPLLREGAKEGRFHGDFSRFTWRTNVRRINLPNPPIPSELDPNMAKLAELKVKYLAHISAIIYWGRAGQEYSESFETIWVSEKLLPKKRF